MRTRKAPKVEIAQDNTQEESQVYAIKPNKTNARASNTITKIRQSRYFSKDILELKHLLNVDGNKRASVVQADAAVDSKAAHSVSRILTQLDKMKFLVPRKGSQPDLIKVDWHPPFTLNRSEEIRKFPGFTLKFGKNGQYQNLNFYIVSGDDDDHILVKSMKGIRLFHEFCLFCRKYDPTALKELGLLGKRLHTLFTFNQQNNKEETLTSPIVLQAASTKLNPLQSPSTDSNASNMLSPSRIYTARSSDVLWHFDEPLDAREFLDAASVSVSDASVMSPSSEDEVTLGRSGNSPR